MVARDPFGFAGRNIESQLRVDAPMGEGGFSVVYRGRHLGLGEDVAIKCLKLPAGLGPELLALVMDRFRAESRIMYRLSQGSLDIARCISSGTAEAPATGQLVPYLVLEWLEGQSLAQDLGRRRRSGMAGRSLSEVLELFEPAAHALEHAHKQGVVHRDVKPGNLFLADTRHGVRLKVLDFGLAKVIDGDGLGMLVSPHTMALAILCSPSYGAPEQFDSKCGPIGTWTDVYAFGLVLLEALGTKKARGADSLADGARQALDPNNVITAHALGIKVPPKVEVLLARAVAFDRTSRPADIGAFWAELKSHAARTATKTQASAVSSAGTQGVDSSAPTLFRPSPDESGPSLPLTQRKALVAPQRALGGTVMMAERPELPAPVTQPMPGRTPMPAPPQAIATPPAPPAPRLAWSSAPPPPAPRRRGAVLAIVLAVLTLVFAAGIGVTAYRFLQARRASPAQD